MTDRPLLTRGAGLALASAMLMAIAGLGLRAVLEPMPRQAPAPTASPTVDFPSAEPSFDLQLPLTVTRLAAGGHVTIDGRGPRQIAFQQDAARPVGVRIECGHCTGTLTLRSGDEPAPLFADAPRAVVDVRITASRPEGLLIVEATGPWRLTLTAE